MATRHHGARVRRRLLTMALVLGLGVTTVAPAAANERPDDRQPRIVGGVVTTNADDWPFMTALINTSDGAQFCGGALVAASWILTAAHCFFQTEAPFAQDVFAGNLALIIGALNIADPDNPVPAGAERIAAAELVIHPGWDASNVSSDNDIALVRLATPSARTPIKLASNANAALWSPGAIGTAKGWGLVADGGAASNDLREVQIPIVSDAACEQTLIGDIVEGHQLCAGDIANGGVDACQGDSGGPLAVPDPAGGWIHVGASSFGEGCGAPNSPGVWTETAAYGAWIAASTGIGGGSSPAGETVGLVDPAQGLWRLRNSAGQVTTFFYGNPGDFPLMGDWDCDGDDTPGMYRQSDGFVYLRNSNSAGPGETRYFLGNPSDIPLAGDFDNDGCDTVSVYRPGEGRFYIANSLGANEGGFIADFSFLFGDVGDKPFVGDFDAAGGDTIGLHRESTGLVYFRNSLTTGVADSQFIFGDPGDRLVAGDWGVVDGADTPALFRPSTTTFFFRHTNTAGVADSSFVFGESAWLPVAGTFGLG